MAGEPVSINLRGTPSPRAQLLAAEHPVCEALLPSQHRVLPQKQNRHLSAPQQLARTLHRKAVTSLERRLTVNLSKKTRQLVRGALLSASVCAALACVAPAMAHHAFAAEYDSEQPLDLSGVVTKARWANPHSWLYFDVKGADGAVTNWGVELGAPNSLALKGLQKADLHAGAPIRVKGYRSKNGGPFGYAVILTLADGRSFQTGGAQDAPPTASP